MFLKAIKLWVVTFIFLALQVTAIAQEDSINYEEEEGVVLLEFLGKPTISLYYGLSKNSLKNLNRSFAKPNFAEIKLGYTSEEVEYEQANILKYDYNYFSVTNISNDLGKKSTSDKINTDLWRIGLGWEDGYGYKRGKSAFLTYNSFGFGWSRLKVKDSVLKPSDKALLSLYDGSFRFGTRTEGGVKIQFIPNLVLDAGFERAIVFPRFLFWKSVGSILLEATAQWMLDEFIDKIMDSSPAAVPVVSFLLKNGLSYTAYELRKEKMNYPFKSTAPLFTDSFKFGLTFIF